MSTTQSAKNVVKIVKRRRVKMLQITTGTTIPSVKLESKRMRRKVMTIQKFGNANPATMDAHLARALMDLRCPNKERECPHMAIGSITLLHRLQGPTIMLAIQRSLG